MATILCPSCGAELDEKKKFCTECGKKLPVAQEQPDEIAMQETRKFEIPEEEASDVAKAVKAVFQDDDGQSLERKFHWGKKKKKTEKDLLPEELDDDQQTIVDFSSLAGSTLDDSPYEPISAWGYIGILVLLAIPVIGWIFAIVWACGGCRKINKRNISRGYLMILALLGVFCLCSLLAVKKIAPTLIAKNPDLASTQATTAQEPVYTVEGTTTKLTKEEEESLDESDDSLITYLKDLGDDIWNAYYDRSLQGGEELTAILEGDRDTLIGLGYNEKSVDQVLNMVNGDTEALSSLLNTIATQQEEQ